MNSFAIRASSMFDGSAMCGPVTVYVKDGTISDIDNTGAPPGTGVKTIELGPEGCLLPGLIDCHVHLAFDASPDPIAALRARDDAQVLEGMRTAARKAVHAGVTSVRDLGDRNYLALSLAQEVQADPAMGPQILSAGPPITTPGGHCDFFGGEAEGAENLRAAVRERHVRGCGVVKVMLSGGSMTPNSAPPHESQYSLEDLQVIVDEAHWLGLPVAAHAHGVGTIRDAVTAGVDTVEHVTFMTRDGVDPSPAVMAGITRAGIFVSLSLGLDRSVKSPPPPDIARRAEGINQVYAEIAQHVPTVVLGTDAGVAPAKPHDVLPLAVAQLGELGMPPVNALAAATSRAATASGFGGRKGRIRRGADADFLAVNGNPEHDLARLQDVQAVFRAGVQVR